MIRKRNRRRYCSIPRIRNQRDTLHNIHGRRGGRLRRHEPTTRITRQRSTRPTAKTMRENATRSNQRCRQMRGVSDGTTNIRGRKKYADLPDKKKDRSHRRNRDYGKERRLRMGKKEQKPQMKDRGRQYTRRTYQNPHGNKWTKEPSY